MKKILYVLSACLLLTVVSSNFCSCNKNEPDNGYYQDEYGDDEEENDDDYYGNDDNDDNNGGYNGDDDNNGGYNGGDDNNGGYNGGDDNNGGYNGGDDNNGGNNGGSSVTVPDAPTGLTGKAAGNINLGFRVELSWNYDSNATKWNVYRSSSANGSYSKIGSNQSMSYWDENPRSGSNFYKVTAVNSAGESAKSDYIEVVVDKNAFAPTFSSIKGSVSGSDITLTWNIKSGEGYGVPARVEAYIYDPSGVDGEGWYLYKTFTGSGITSGSYTWYFYEGYLYYNSVRMMLKAANEYGEDSRTIWYLPNDNQWTGTF